MQQVNISGKEYNISFTPQGLEVQYFDDNTGLETVFVFKKLEITDNRIDTTFTQYEIAPNNGQRINERRYTRQTPNEEYQVFTQSPLADAIKKNIVNGLFRLTLNVSDKIYDDAGNLIPNQPYQIQ